MAARFRIIVLEQSSHGSGLGRDWRLLLWADVPSARQQFYATPGAVSEWKDALTTDNAQLASGAVAERLVTLQQKSTGTIADLQAIAQAMWTAWQAEVTARNPWNRYGTTWDGTSWVLGGVS